MNGKSIKWDSSGGGNIKEDIFLAKKHLLQAMDDKSPIHREYDKSVIGEFKIAYKVTKSGKFYRCHVCKKLFPSHERRVSTISIHEDIECNKM